MINAKQFHVLLIEGNSAEAALIRDSLSRVQRGSFIVDSVDTLQNGMSFLASGAVIDVILLDLNLTAAEACDSFSAIYTQTPKPIIVLAGTVDDTGAAQLLKQPGVQDVLAKEEARGEVLAYAISYAIDRYQMQTAFQKNTLRYLKKDELLQKTQRKIIEQERMRAFGQMASGITHDFNNALMPVLGFTEILLNHKNTRDDKKKLLEYLELISTSAKDAVSIVARLREFYRNKEDLEVFLPVNFQDLVKQVALMTQPKWKDQTQSKGITIRIEMQLDTSPAVLGNEVTLREALTNLIFNAVDAMPNGGRLILRSRDAGERLVFEIEDTGTGMTEDTAAHCFEPFFSTKGKNGTGLGLAMVHGIVRRHEGTIDVRSEPGKGTIFSIQLPYAKQSAAPEKKESPKEQVRPLKILIVDDDDMIRQVLRGYLEKDGHTVVAAQDGMAALNLFKEGKFDLVITDRAMPGLSGDQLALKLKKIESRTPVIMLTGFGDLMKAKNEIVPGIDCVLSKPATIEVIRETLARVITSATRGFPPRDYPESLSNHF